MGDLQRTVGLFGASIYGVGLILGAGIYAILGEAVAAAGQAVVVSFVLAATVASLTGLSYAELASRYPRGEGEYLYAWAAFGNKRLSELTALFRVLTGVISAAAVALAFGGYLSAFVPVSIVPVALLLVVGMSAINGWGIEASTRVNVLFTLIEIAGLAIVIAIGLGTWGSVEVMVPASGPVGVLEGTFLVFFAYLGFEALVNIAEETTNPSVTIPRAIGISIAFSTAVYLAVALSALGLVEWRDLGASAAPLADVAGAGLGSDGFALLTAIALFATANTVLILLVSTSRIVYGVSKEEYNSFPAAFARVHSTRQTPYLAVALVGVVTVPFAVLGDLGRVAELANFSLLIVFVVVNASLLKLRITADPDGDGYRVPLNVGNVPLTAVGGLVTSVGLLLFYLSQFVR